MIRDGGSIAAEFEDESAARYILFIPIHITTHGHELERLGYDQPVLIDCDPDKRLQNTATVRYSELCGPHVPVTWDEARRIVEAITTLSGERSSLETKWLRQMAYVVASNGRLPPDLESTTWSSNSRNASP